MKILFYLSLLSPVIPILAGVKKKFSLLWLYVITGLLFDLIIILFRHRLEINFLPVANLFFLTEFILVSLVFKSQLYNNKMFYLFITGMALFFIASCYNTYDKELNTFGASFFSLSYIIYSLSGFFFILKEQKDLYLERSYVFWLCVAFLIYASGNLLLFLFKEQMQQINSEFYRTLWNTFFRSLNIIKNLILAIAISKYTRKVA